jgi:hypothetical protein
LIAPVNALRYSARYVGGEDHARSSCAWASGPLRRLPSGPTPDSK